MSPQAGKKDKKLDRVAEDNGVAVAVLDAGSHEISVSNNNSICRALTASPDFSPKCAEYCGIAYQRTAAGEPFEYTCYAGLTCKAVPVADRGKRFVAIVGRTFLTAENYRKATDRAILGDWKDFPPNEFFANVLMTGSVSPIEAAVEELSQFRVSKTDDLLDLEVPRTEPVEKKAEVIQPDTPIKQATTAAKAVPEPPAATSPSELMHRRANEAAELRSLYGRLAILEYITACEIVLEFVSATFKLDSLVWLERKNNRFTITAARGALLGMPIKIGVAADNERLLASSQGERAFELRERMEDDEGRPGRVLNVFASVVGGEIRGAIGVEGEIDDKVAAGIARLCRRVGPQLEILRLQHEVSSRDWLNRAVSRFNESLKRIDAEEFWTDVTQLSAELVQSERASLLVRGEQSDKLRAQAAIGSRVNLFAEPDIGHRVAKLVLEDGNPVIVEDIKRIGVRAAPAEWNYKTESFLSYPILIGERRIAVMNFTDKAGGGVFGERDLELLQAIGPQIAVAIDRTVLKDKAGEFEQLSVTDALTGLLNRRYLEKRLAEEIQRPKRHRFPMSLMMLDVDAFKSYNDTFGHPAGDTALKIVASVLQDILRGADVAARYGGEEFAILLPQTTSGEAAAIAERLRQRIEHTEFPKRKITVSIGIASCSSEIDSPENIVGAADHALYEAKNHGRNNVQVYDGFGNSFNEKIH